MGVTISGMMGQGRLNHNNRTFSAKNVDRSRTGQNVTFCRVDLEQLYHQEFDQALAEYNAKKKKTRDKIPDYYEHIRTGKQEKLFHEVIFQIGNLGDCGCGTPNGDQAAAVLAEFAGSFQERNPHLRVFNSVLHMDEATPHVHIDFVPVATEQKRGLATRVSLKQALKQQGFTSEGMNRTEWNSWMEREKHVLTGMAEERGFEIVSLGGGRKHMELPEYRAAAQRLEAVKEQTAAAEQGLEKLRETGKGLQETVEALQTANGVRVDLESIQPKKTLTGAITGVSVEQVEQLKGMAAAGAYQVKKLAEENQRLRRQVPTVEERMQEAKTRQGLQQENRQLREEVGFLRSRVKGLEAALRFLEERLPEQLRPLIEKARQLVPVLMGDVRSQHRSRRTDFER